MRQRHGAICGYHKIVGVYGQRAQPLSGRMVDRVRDRRGDPGDADFADTADAERIEVRIVLSDEAHVDGADTRLAALCLCASSGDMARPPLPQAATQH